LFHFYLIQPRVHSACLFTVSQLRVHNFLLEGDERSVNSEILHSLSGLGWKWFLQS
jgi:hypothetical protein